MRTNEALIRQALACIRWLTFGEQVTPEWDGPPPRAGDTMQALRAALASAPPAAEPVNAMEADGNATNSYLFKQMCAHFGIKLGTDTVNTALAKIAAPQPAEPAQPATQAGAVMESISVIREIMQFIRQKVEGVQGLGFDAELAERRVNARLDQIAAAQPTEQPSQDANPPR